MCSVEISCQFKAISGDKLVIREEWYSKLGSGTQDGKHVPGVLGGKRQACQWEKEGSLGQGRKQQPALPALGVSSNLLTLLALSSRARNPTAVPSPIHFPSKYVQTPASARLCAGSWEYDGV
jgi:hypothetical protein